MSYVIVTCHCLVWFLTTILADMFLLTAMVTPKWLIGPVPYIIAGNVTLQRYPSLGINTRYTLTHLFAYKQNSHYKFTFFFRSSVERQSINQYSCVLMNKLSFNCGTFDLDGLTTVNSVYPLPWKIAKMFIVLGFIIMTFTIFLTAASCCRQSILGKSIHTITGSAQAIAGKFKAVFMHFHTNSPNNN